MNKNQKLYVPLSIEGIDMQDVEPIIEELVLQGWKKKGSVTLLSDFPMFKIKMEVLTR